MEACWGLGILGSIPNSEGVCTSSYKQHSHTHGFGTFFPSLPPFDPIPLFSSLFKLLHYSPPHCLGVCGESIETTGDTISTYAHYQLQNWIQN